MQRNSGTRKVGDPTETSDKYAIEIAIERISGEPYGEPVKAWTLNRGHEMEGFARMGYEARTMNLASESGVILTDDRKYGYSSDGLVGDDGLIEIKCPVDTIKIMAMLTTHDVSEYMHQIQTGLWITGRKWCDFIQYVPALEHVGKELFYKRVHRDDNFIDEMVEKLVAFEQRVTQYEAALRKQAA
jgi:exodeoxyribonuclease (lambda-induced)